MKTPSKPKKAVYIHSLQLKTRTETKFQLQRKPLKKAIISTIKCTNLTIDPTVLASNTASSCFSFIYGNYLLKLTYIDIPKCRSQFSSIANSWYIFCLSLVTT
jgi:hypothetical protein